MDVKYEEDMTYVARVKSRIRFIRGQVQVVQSY